VIKTLSKPQLHIKIVGTLKIDTFKVIDGKWPTVVWTSVPNTQNTPALAATSVETVL
jgi:hypothetical protein